MGNTLATVTDGHVSYVLACTLAGVARNHSLTRTDDICRRTIERFLAGFAKMTTNNQRWRLEAILELVDMLPTDQAVTVCGSVAEQLVANHELDPELVYGLAKLAGRLPPGRAVALCRPVADRLTAALAEIIQREGANYLEMRATPGHALAALLPLFPIEPTGTALAAELEKASDAYVRDGIAEPFAHAASGLSRGDRLRRKYETELAALAGWPAVYTSAPPLAKPLPPQELVELLKHPFCLQELRRAVLDALEITYARKFKDLWDFVAFAEAEHPELDLLTPPTRPK